MISWLCKIVLSCQKGKAAEGLLFIVLLVVAQGHWSLHWDLTQLSPQRCHQALESYLTHTKGKTSSEIEMGFGFLTSSNKFSHPLWAQKIQADPGHLMMRMMMTMRLIMNIIIIIVVILIIIMRIFTYWRQGHMRTPGSALSEKPHDPVWGFPKRTPDFHFNHDDEKTNDAWQAMMMLWWQWRWIAFWNSAST